MKLAGRKHEILLTTIITILVSIKCLNSEKTGFLLNGQKLIELVPLWTVYFSYLWANYLIIPRFFSFEGENQLKKRRYINIIFGVVQLLIISYLIGPLCNFVTYYNGSESHLVFNGFIGYHPQPIKNTFGGFYNGLTVVLIYMIYAGFREVFIFKVEKTHKITDYEINLVNWLTLFMVPFTAIACFLQIFQIETFTTFYLFYIFGLLSFISVGILNLFWLYPKFVDKKISRVKFITLLFFYSFVITFAFSMFFGPFWSVPLFIGLWLVQLVIVAPFTWLIFKQQKENILELIGTRKQLFKSNADLQLLRSQINPHFLFNSLNTIYGTAIMDGSDRTAQAVQKLGDMMRFMIHDNTRDFIPMAKEIEYLKNYISLQKLRSAANNEIVIEEDINELHCNHEIVPMLLIPFVENAFKHGIGASEKSWVRVSLHCDLRNINFRVVNSMPDVSTNEDPERNNSGVGIQNVKERLALVYKDRYLLNYGQKENEFIVELSIEIF